MMPNLCLRASYLSQLKYNNFSHQILPLGIHSKLPVSNSPAQSLYAIPPIL